jgi:rhamnose transport system permease protein
MSALPTRDAATILAADARRRRGRSMPYVREVSVLGAYALILLLLGVFAPRYFREQFAANWVESAPVLVAAVGMTLVILGRHIDISIGSQFSVCAVLAALMANAGLPMPLVAVCTVACGAVLGAFNGALIAFLGLPSIVVTLAMMTILAQSLGYARRGAEVDWPPGFQWFGRSQTTGQVMIVAIALIVFAAFAWGLRWLAAGRAVYAVGSDEEAARLAGVRPKRVVFAVFVLMGALTALAALVNAATMGKIYPNTGEGKELQVIAAVVVGGVAITGGRGTLVGTLIGVALLGAVPAALAFLNVPTAWTRAVQGAIILLSVSAEGAIGLFSGPGGVRRAEIRGPA